MQEENIVAVPTIIKDLCKELFTRDPIQNVRLDLYFTGWHKMLTMCTNPTSNFSQLKETSLKT